MAGRSLILETDSVVAFAFFGSGFLGVLPGVITVLPVIIRSWRLRGRVERLALEQRRFNDPIFSNTQEGRFRWEAFSGMEYLLVEGDSDALREAKRALIDAVGPMRRRVAWGALMLLLGMPVAAALGFFTCVWLGLAPMPGPG